MAVQRACRRLRKAPTYTIAAILTLTIGIGITTAVAVLVNAVLIRPLPYRNADRLVALGHRAARDELAMTGLSAGTFLYYRAQNRVFEDIGAYVEHVYTVTDRDAPEQLHVAAASPSVFSVLGARAVLGRLPPGAATAEEARHWVLVSHDLWARRYGADRRLVGRTIEIDGESYVVIGVLEPGFHFPDADTQLWLVWPQEGSPARDRSGVRGLYMSGVARLKPGITPEVAERDLQRLVRSLPEVFPDVSARMLNDMRLRATVRPLKDATIGDARSALLLLLATAAFLLLITWSNATSLALVRAEQQRRDVAIERALGASTRGAAVRFLGEALVIAALSGGLALALAWIAVSLRFGFDPEALPRLREVGFGGVGVAVVLGLTGLAAVSLYAAGRAGTRVADLSRTLVSGSGRMTGTGREQRRRQVLVVAQVALALILLAGSALMARSFWRLRAVKLGFRPGGALTFFLPVPPSMYGNYHASARVHAEILSRLRALPGVTAADAATQSVFPLTPVASYYSARIAATDRAAGDSASWPFALFGFATPGYFRSMGIPLVAGRTFRPSDVSRDAPGVIVSASLARALFGTASPVGQRVRWATTTRFPAYTVVGVVGDVAAETRRQGPSRALYLADVYPPQADTVTGVIFDYVPSEEMYVVRTTLPASAVVPAVRRAVQEVDPRLVIAHVQTLEGLVAGSMARDRLTLLLLCTGAATALFLAVVGIYGVLAYAVRQRRAELAVRIALGATPARVVRMVVRDGAVLAGAGALAGLAGALALTRFLGSLLYEVSPSDPLVLGGAVALLALVALAASYLPARRAGRTDPMSALDGG